LSPHKNFRVANVGTWVSLHPQESLRLDNLTKKLTSGAVVLKCSLFSMCDKNWPIKKWNVIFSFGQKLSA
jgi:hypothetical protein